MLYTWPFLSASFFLDSTVCPVYASQSSLLITTVAVLSEPDPTMYEPGDAMRNTYSVDDDLIVTIILYGKVSY